MTLIDGKPVILYDCFNVPDCRPPPPPRARGGRGARGWGAGDPAIVGVARPADYSDANLTKWEKDPRNPIVIRGGGR